MKKYGQNMASAETNSATTERKRSSVDDLFSALPQKPADNGPHSRFFEKVKYFHILFTIYSHFQFFPDFPENLLRADRET